MVRSTRAGGGGGGSVPAGLLLRAGAEVVDDAQAVADVLR